MDRRILIMAAAVVLAVSPGCGDSNDVTSPGGGLATVNVSGDWSGQYASNSPSLCSHLMATAKLTQEGSRVTGSFKALGCGVNGTFNGTVSGNMLSGSVDMAGCTGGTVTGRMDGGSLSFTVSDFTKPLINGDIEVMPGGQASLQR
jgi:hypothetical protein